MPWPDGLESLRAYHARNIAVVGCGQIPKRKRAFCVLECARQKGLLPLESARLRVLEGKALPRYLCACSESLFSPYTNKRKKIDSGLADKSYFPKCSCAYNSGVGMTTNDLRRFEMYDKDKRQRITLRLSDEQFEFIKGQCDVLGINPSDYLRMLVNSVLFTTKAKKELNLREVLGRENDKTNSDGQL